MPYKTVDVDVYYDIDDFETHELVSELIQRIDLAQNKADFLMELRPLINHLAIGLETKIPAKSIEDLAKIEHLSGVWNKYTSAEIESKLP